MDDGESTPGFDEQSQSTKHRQGRVPDRVLDNSRSVKMSPPQKTHFGVAFVNPLQKTQPLLTENEQIYRQSSSGYKKRQQFSPKGVTSRVSPVTPIRVIKGTPDTLSNFNDSAGGGNPHLNKQFTQSYVSTYSQHAGITQFKPNKVTITKGTKKPNRMSQSWVNDRDRYTHAKSEGDIDLLLDLIASDEHVEGRNQSQWVERKLYSKPH